MARRARSRIASPSPSAIAWRMASRSSSRSRRSEPSWRSSVTSRSRAPVSAARKKWRSNSSSKTRRSSWDLATVDASASRKSRWSVQATSPSASNASRISEVPTATPSERRSSKKASRFSGVVIRQASAGSVDAGSPSFTATRSATRSMSERCLTMMLIESSKTLRSMSSAPISSRVRAQSIDSAIDGGFFRSSWRIMWMTSTRRSATASSSSGVWRRTISSSRSAEG